MKILILGLSLVLGWAAAARADDFFDGLIVSEEMKQDELGQSGQLKAGELLNRKPMMLKVRKQKVLKEDSREDSPAPVIREPAPFGLKWLATMEEIRYLHIRLTPIEVKDTPNSYKASNLPKAVSEFDQVIISFGDNDALWRIAAYGKPMNDDDQASKGLAQYNKYYKMLAKKYGNPQQFYTPAAVNVDETVQNEDGTTSVQTHSEEMPLGAKGFLQKLVSGEATLYATFENGRIGVTLALLADGNDQTYIVVDYKNLEVTKKESEDIYDSL